jgi:outer membrane protein OmpA-like peptidoglycan-associated protein
VQSIDYSSYPRVSVIMQVADRVGRNVRGLGLRDFAFRDTALKLLSVQPVDSGLTVPVDIVMLIDCSASMVQKIAAVRANVEAFLRNIESRGANYRIGGVLYGSMIYDTLHPTANFTTFRSFIAGAAAIGSDEISSLALKAASEMNFRPDAQRVVILITDDWAVQENSRLNEADLTQLLWNTGARLYTIITPCKNNSAVMTRLSLGGEYDIEKPFNAILNQIGTDITTVYRLLYQAPPRDTLAQEPAESMATLIGTVTDENGRGIQTDVRIEDGATLANVAVVHGDSSGQYQILLPRRGIFRITAVRPDFIATPVEIDASQIGRGAMILQELHITSIDAAIANGTIFTLRNIFFDYDRTDLKPESLPELEKLATLLDEYPTVKVEIVAHTDALGSDEYNQTLSETRAQSVMAFLVGKGIASDRVIAKGYGRSRPIAPNGTDEGRAMNRRVEFKLFR